MLSRTARALALPPPPSSRSTGRDLAVVSGFQGADAYSENRGYIYFPTLDTRRELDSYSRYELTRRARFLYNNVGMVRRIINGISRMVVGRGIRPRPKTKDANWNALALADFNNTAESAAVFDVGGRYNFYAAQRAFMRGKLKDGNMFSILAKTASGLPAVRLFESHQIGNGSNDYAGSLPAGLGSGSGTFGNGNQWIDGVLVNRNNRRIAYRVLDDNDNATPIDAQDLIAFSDLERPGQVLGATCLYHAINNCLDIAEISGFLKMGIKQSALIGYAIKNATRKPGLGGNVKKVRAGAGPNDQIKVEEMFRGGKAVELEPGAEMDVLTDSRPHPNAMGFFNDLRRDIAWGVGLSPEILWDIQTLGGANTRFIIADAQEYVEEQQDELIDVFCKRYWVYQTAVKLGSGQLPPCEDPEWWKCDWIRPRKLTVDRGKDGKLYIELQGRGMLSLERWYGEQGQDWKPEMSQFLDERAWIKDEAAQRGLSLDDIFSQVSAQSIGAPPPTAQDQPAKQTKPDPDEDPDPDTKLEQEGEEDEEDT